MRISKPLKEKIEEIYDCSERTVLRLIKKRWNHGGTTFSRQVAALSLLADKGEETAPYAKDGELEELRELQTYLKSTASSVSKTPTKKSKSSKQTIKVNQFVLKTELGDTPHNLTQTEMNKAETMSEIYYHLYVFENSIRKFIQKVMSDKYGDKWWDKIVLRKSTLKKVTDRVKKEKKNRWLDGRRGMHPIYYVDFEDYKAILMNHPKLFESYFDDSNWVLATIGETTLSRHNVAHMGYLGDDTRHKILLNLRAWLRQISEL